MVCKPFQQPTIGDYVSITPERSIPNNKPPLEKVYGIKFATLVHLCFHGYAVNTWRLQLLSQCTERFGVRQPRTLRGISAPVRAHDENGSIGSHSYDLVKMSSFWWHTTFADTPLFLYREGRSRV